MSSDKVNWKQVRADAAVAAMPFLQQVFKDNHKVIVEQSTKLADALIAELKRVETNEKV